jgi:hypothetical protein
MASPAGTTSTFGFRVNPPDPNSAVGPNNIVETVNLVWAANTKTWPRTLGPHPDTAG